MSTITFPKAVFTHDFVPHFSCVICHPTSEQPTAATMQVSDERDKKQRARLVFGIAVAEDDSLAYSSSSPDTNASSLDTSTNASSTDGILTAAPSEDSFARSLSGPFDKIIGGGGEAAAGAAGKENTPKPPPTTIAGKPATAAGSAAHKTSHGLTGRRQSPLLHRSPLRRDLVKKTQDAINRASVSVQQSIAAPKLARHVSFQEKLQRTSKGRREWEQERAAAAAFYQQAQKQRLEALEAKRNLSSHYSEVRSNKLQGFWRERRQAIDRELEFQSSVFREHQQLQREQQQMRRRDSNEANSKVRMNHREGAERLKQQQIEEEMRILEERHAASVALRERNAQNAQARRRSFSFRNGDARRIRQLFKEQEEQRLRREHESFELKWGGEKDAEAAQRKAQEERRQSLAARGVAHQQARERLMAQLEAERAREHQSHELEWEAERDAAACRRRLEVERRKSLELRNLDASRQRKEEMERESQELKYQHASFELKWAGEKDAEMYRKRLEQERRVSLEGRNLEAHRQRREEQKQRSEELMAKHASFELKWAGDRDAGAYRKQLDDERRESLAFRNQEGRRQRHLTESQRAKERDAEHASYELKWAADRDVEAYKCEMQKERRESLERRNKERRHHAEVMQELQAIAREAETESLVLKWSGEKDAKAYLAKLAEERRKSLQLRGEQVQHHRQVESIQREEELQRAHEDELLRSSDQKEVEAYKQACAEREKASLQYQRKEAQVQRLEEKERHMSQRQIDELNEDLETQARFDVEDYILSCKRRRRLSLAFRAKEKRRHADWRREQEEREREARSREVRDRLIDRRHEELARQQEQARAAMDAIRHAGCTFNPFSGL